MHCNVLRKTLTPAIALSLSFNFFLKKSEPKSRRKKFMTCFNVKCIDALNALNGDIENWKKHFKVIDGCLFRSDNFLMTLCCACECFRNLYHIETEIEIFLWAKRFDDFIHRCRLLIGQTYKRWGEREKTKKVLKMHEKVSLSIYVFLFFFLSGKGAKASLNNRFFISSLICTSTRQNQRRVNQSDSIKLDDVING